MPPEGFIYGAFKRVRNAGPMPWNDKLPGWPFEFTRSELDALRVCIKRGLLEVDYDDKDNLVIRAPMLGPPAPAKEANDERLPYAETPALLALRERRRRLGR